MAKILKLEPCDLASMTEWVVYRKRLEPKSKEGEFRTIYAPGKKLKRAQSRIKVLLERVEKPEWVFRAQRVDATLITVSTMREASILS